MNKQYVEGVQNEKVLPFPGRVRNNISPIQKTKANRNLEGFSRLDCDTQWGS